MSVSESLFQKRVTYSTSHLMATCSWNPAKYNSYFEFFGELKPSLLDQIQLKKETFGQNTTQTKKNGPISPAPPFRSSNFNHLPIIRIFNPRLVSYQPGPSSLSDLSSMAQNSKDRSGPSIYIAPAPMKNSSTHSQPPTTPRVPFRLVVVHFGSHHPSASTVGPRFTSPSTRAAGQTCDCFTV